ncbi:MAG: cytochrome c biogenesis protein CcdA [Clostridiales bacterium]|jgi:cytochrome c-type biogenesis protein|nr:cytochrome c biogenesis protein CcdA [Clostridiales bacterium]HOJ35537.1 cytochrome c biogenesis protein CcdA [Clostridiales bacterium]HOL78889.1 cytochrome c biogenesis protein CcdA [Clostridiales bacterium]HPP68023.1 cytochrome c biogenesis protein CcdA [Clostridiales bacterium]HPU67842.1 cytochrome c biogenesis protein CcdA [Clostridiales bacterium]
MQYLLLFLEGIITFISPCILPLLPVYVSYFAAGQAAGKKALINSIGFVSGFSAMFIAMGAFAGTVGRLLQSYSTVVNIVTGLIVIVLGLNFLGVLKIGLLNRSGGKDREIKELGFFSSLLFGIIFSIGWTPCVGAFLGSALMMAAVSGSAFKGITMLLAFSLGLGLPFIMSAILLDRLKTAFDFIKKNYKVINTLSGVLLIIVGILMATGIMGRFLSLLTF